MQQSCLLPISIFDHLGQELYQNREKMGWYTGSLNEGGKRTCARYGVQTPAAAARYDAGNASNVVYRKGREASVHDLES